MPVTFHHQRSNFHQFRGIAVCFTPSSLATWERACIRAHPNRDDYQQEAEDLLETIEQVEETLTVMSKVVGQLKEQVASHLDPNTVEMSAEEFLDQCENLEGTWH